MLATHFYSLKPQQLRKSEQWHFLLLALYSLSLPLALRDYKINSYHISCKRWGKFSHKLYLALMVAYQLRAASALCILTP